MGKLLLGIVIGVILVGGGYCAWTKLYPSSMTQTYGNPDSSSASSAPTVPTQAQATTPAPAAASTAAPTTIHYASPYGFSLTLPATWSAYKIKQYTSSEAVAYVYVELPTTDASPASVVNDEGYFSPFAIGVYTPAQWAAAEAEGGPLGAQIGHNSQYVFNWSHANGGSPSDWTMEGDVAGIIASFSLN